MLLKRVISDNFARVYLFFEEFALDYVKLDFDLYQLHPEALLCCGDCVFSRKQL